MKKITLILFLIITSSFSQVVETKNINSNLKGVVLATYFTYKEASLLASKFQDKDIYIKETTKDDKKYFVVFMVNIEKENQYKILNQIKSTIPSAYITSDARVKQLSQDNQNIKAEKRDYRFKRKSTSSLNQLYTQGYNFYKRKEYQKAIGIFDMLVDKYPTNTNINFYLGKSLYELKRYDEAVAAFSRLEILNENNLRVKLELAQTYLMLGLYDDAIKNFTFVLKHKIPDNVKKNVLKRLDYIKSKEKRYSFYHMVKLGYTYDDNINNTTSVKTFNTPDYEGLIITDKKYADSSFLTQINGHYRYKSDDTKDYSLNLNYTQQNYYKDKDRENRDDTNASGIEKEDKKNIQILSLDLGLSKRYLNNNHSFLVNLTSIRLANKSYMDIFGTMYSYEKKYLSDIKFLAFANISKKNYKQSDSKDENSYSIKVGVGETIPTQDLGIFNSTYIYERDIKENDTIDNTDKKIDNIILSNRYNFSPVLYSNISYAFIVTSELDNDPTFKKKRTDKTSRYSFGLGYYLNQNTEIYTNIENIHNNSTIDIFGYKKYKFNSNISYSF